jgi:hypothetical protein
MIPVTINGLRRLEHTEQENRDRKDQKLTEFPQPVSPGFQVRRHQEGQRQISKMGPDSDQNNE